MEAMEIATGIFLLCAGVVIVLGALAWIINQIYYLLWKLGVIKFEGKTYKECR